MLVAADRTSKSSSPLARRQRLLLGIACSTAILSTMGMVASFWVDSPAEVAAQAKPPRASILTAPVEYKILKRTVIFRGSFTSTKSVDFAPASALDPSGGSGSAGGEMVVTKTPRKPGDQVQPGMLLVEISYRPVFALHGKIPAIRDLTQGVSGPDVTQLQRGLDDLGYGRGSDQQGHFGSGTAQAVRRFYTALGYPVPVVAKESPGDAPKPVLSTRSRSTSLRIQARDKAKKLVRVPKSEVMFLPSFPARITALGGAVGARPSSTLLKVTLGGLRLIGHLDPSAEGTVNTNQQVQVLLEDSGKQYPARVTRVGQIVKPKESEKDSNPAYIPVTIVGDRPWSPVLNNQDARITVTAAATESQVLAVPEGAITAPADGQASVTVLTGKGERRRVPVIAGMSADGFVEVRPQGGQLHEGDKVVVGR
ncbi:hypothetical protein ACRB68_33890 [Actinomadura sp. RB68]|uniref:Peptidoglycan binding-like domain-containing protein n=2 Tax=Actinomadura macrotermitis TaxID=2585200 RepID=A0A7K0BW67_9ACTN|nr:hypothetical protein [Actinomadura macrotermitis]